MNASTNFKFTRLHVLGLATACCTLMFSAHAADDDALALEEVIVTAVPTGVSKMSSSLSITSLTSQQALDTVPRSTQDILLTVPGVHIEASGGSSNANISVRGVPIASGGTKYLQLHEDGLPVLEFGDIIVGNVDNYFFFDRSVSRLEVVKGGTAATLISNSPAGVINFVSKRGEVEGGAIAINRGVDYDSNRIDFDYGKPLGVKDDWLFHIGGFFHYGEGPRDTNLRGQDGGQLRLSLQKNFDNGGHIRVYVKSLDATTQTYLPMPVRADGKNTIPNFDVVKTANVPTELYNNITGDQLGGGRISSIGDGSSVKSTVVGGDMRFELTRITTLDYRFRVARNSGKFFGAFTAGLGSASGFIANPGSLTNVYTMTPDDPETEDVNEAAYLPNLSLRYASGSNRDQTLTADELTNLNSNGLLQNIRSFDNDINSLDNFSHNLSFNFEVAEGHDLTVGIYQATQEIDINWYWQTYIADVHNAPRLLDIYSDGSKLTDGGTVAFGAPDWGYCCYRDTELEAALGATYLSYVGQLGSRFTLNASVRFDYGEASGHYASGITPQLIDVDGDGEFNLAEAHSQVLSQDQLSSSRFAYKWSYTSWALGGNVLLNEKNALFFNFSAGGRVNADRLGDGGYFRNGKAATDSVVNALATFELGYKASTEYFDTILTLFSVGTADANSEGTRGETDTAVIRDYTSTGMEWEFNVSAGIFDMRGSFTFVSAEISGAPNNPALVGKTPRRQPSTFIVLAPQVRFGTSERGSKSAAGLSLVSVGESYAQDANGYKLPAYTYFNLFVRGYVADNFSLGLDINNLTNTVGLTEAEENAPLDINGVQYVRARSITGRTISISAKLDF